MNNFRVLYSNINGIKSKSESLKNIVEEKKPTVVMLVETKLEIEDDFKIEGYTTHKMNRNENGGGVMILVKEELKNITVEVADRNEIGEAKWISINNGRTNVRIGVLYAPQEHRTSVQQLKIMYNDLKEQIQKAKINKQEVLLIGDFNAKVGELVTNNHTEVSKSGKLLIKLLDSMHLKLMNTSSSCNGLWTRTEKKKKSVIDYVIMDEEGEDLVSRMEIDEGRNFTPYHVHGGRTVYSDHNSIILDINWNMRYKSGEHKVCKINRRTNEEFKRRTEESNFTELIANNQVEIQEKYSHWNDEIMKFTRGIREKREEKESRTRCENPAEEKTIH